MKVRFLLDTDEAHALLQRAADAMLDTTPLMAQIGEYMVDSTKQRFQSGTSPDGTPWEPNSLAPISRQGGARPLWGASGNLSSRIDTIPTRNAVSWGSPLRYAAVQQFGASKGSFGSFSGVDKNGRPFSGAAPWADIPARPFIGVSQTDEANLKDLIGEWLESALS